MLTKQKPDMDADHLYVLCFFDEGRAIQGDEFLEALSDADAVDRVIFIKPWTTREIWEHHRLVCVVPPFASIATIPPQLRGVIEA